MVQDAPRSDPARRWLLLLHVLFGATLGVPTIVVLVAGGPGSGVTVGIAIAFAAWYAVAFVPHAQQEALGPAVVYAIGALAFFTVLNVRSDFYLLLFYSLLPQFFSMLPRALAVLGVAGIVLLPATVSGGVGELLRDPGALFSLLAAVGLGLVVTAVIEALGRQTIEQRDTIAELERAREDNERLLATARRDVRDRDALARAGHALIAARSPVDVAAAIGEHMAEHSAQVRGVALLTLGDDTSCATVIATVSGTASPALGDTVAVPRQTSDGVAVVLNGDEARRAGLPDARARPRPAPAEPPGAQAVALLSLRTAAHVPSDQGDLPSPPADANEPELLWIGLGRSPRDETAVRDLSTIATETALALANLRLASQAAAQGRTAGVLAERQRLAHEIHDTLAQGFTSIVTQLEAAEQALGQDASVTAVHLGRAKRTARDSLHEARRTVEALRPAPLEQAGLPAALRHLAMRWRDVQTTPTRIAVAVDGDPARTAQAVDDALLRVVQEALANVSRHAGASHVDLTLSYVDDLVLLDVQDDGVGFDIAATTTDSDVSHGGYGLTSMRERVALVGGALVIESAPGDGTTVAARIPRRPVVGADTREEQP